MTWNIRHQGSPRSAEGLTLTEVVEGLQDGLWEPTDEVMGPEDADWIPIESHPALAEIALDMEPPPAKQHDDETHLDMTALIDVCLVLLIFFILTASYAALQKMLDAPTLAADKSDGPLVLSKEQVLEVMIHLIVRQENGQTVLRIENQVVEKENLIAVLTRFANAKRRRTDLLIDSDKEVPHGVIVAIQDAAKSADLARIFMLAHEDELPSGKGSK